MINVGVAGLKEEVLTVFELCTCTHPFLMQEFFCSGSSEFKSLSIPGFKPINLKATVLPVRGTCIT